MLAKSLNCSISGVKLVLLTTLEFFIIRMHILKNDFWTTQYYWIQLNFFVSSPCFSVHFVGDANAFSRVHSRRRSRFSEETLILHRPW